MRNSNPATAGLPRLVGPAEVRKALGISSTTLWRWVNEQRTFPRPIKLTRSKVAWPEETVRAWIAEQVAAANKTGGQN